MNLFPFTASLSYPRVPPDRPIIRFNEVRRVAADAAIGHPGCTYRYQLPVGGAAAAADPFGSAGDLAHHSSPPRLVASCCKARRMSCGASAGAPSASAARTASSAAVTP